MKKASNFIILLLMIVHTIIPSSAFAEQTAEMYQTYYERHPGQEDDFLGAAQHFNVFARNVHITTDINGNVAAQNLYSTQQSFDIWRGREKMDLIKNDDDYIQNILAADGTPAPMGTGIPANTGNNQTTYLALGEGIDYQAVGTDGKPTINGVKNDQTTAKQIVQDQNGQTFIDFDSEFTHLRSANDELAKNAQSADIVVESEDQFLGGTKGKDAVYTASGDLNNRVIDVSQIDKEAVVIKLNAAVLADTYTLDIVGLEAANASDTNKEVFIVVDGEGSDSVTINGKIKLYYKAGENPADVTGNTFVDNQGNTEQERLETELMDFADSTVLWSFTNTTQVAGKLSIGKMKNIELHSPWIGSILAPDATVDGTGVNIQGSVIADTYLGSGSLYRWDWQGEFSPNKTNGEKVLVEKYDGHTKEKLTDAKLMDTLTYTVTNLASKQTTELTEKNNWEASFVPGDYQIVETNAPEGYAVDTTPINFTIDQKMQVTSGSQLVDSVEPTSSGLYLKDNQLVFRQFDEPKQATVKKNIHLLKYDQTTKKEVADLSGLTFKLTSYQDEARQQVKEQIPLTKDYQAELEPGFYGVQEETAPIGYALENSEYYFTIDSTGAVKGADSSAIATWSDGYLTQAPGSADTLYQSADQLYFQKFDQNQKQAKEFNLQLLKYDKSTKKQVSDLSGLSFQLTQYQAGEHKQVIEQQMITGNQISDFTIKLKPGYDYTIKEIKAPNGYELSNSNFDFKITEDGQLSSEKSVGVPQWNPSFETKAETNQDILYQDGKQLYYQKFDKKIAQTVTKKIKLLKYDKTTRTPIGTLTGLKFTITQYSDEKYTKTSRVIDVAQDYTAELTPGHYSITETSAPTGFSVEHTPYYFTIKADGGVKVLHGSLKEWSAGYLVVANTNEDQLYQNKDQLYFEKFDTTQMDQLQLHLLKYDGQTQKAIKNISKLKFQVTQYQQADPTKVVKVQQLSGEEASDFTMTVKESSIYKIQEISAPEGYQLDDSTFEFTVDANGTFHLKGGQAAPQWQSSDEAVASTKVDQLYQQKSEAYFQKMDKKKAVPILPQTGGHGTLGFYLSASLFIVLAGILYKKRIKN